jgi:hypothetical protein
MLSTPIHYRPATPKESPMNMECIVGSIRQCFRVGFVGHGVVEFEFADKPFNFTYPDWAAYDQPKTAILRSHAKNARFWLPGASRCCRSRI